jgi:hypothetical protein
MVQDSRCAEIRNPNVEIRNKSEGGKKYELENNTKPLAFHLFSLFLYFPFVSDFDIRISDFPRMQSKFTQQELEGYLEESLPPELMAAVEAALRADPTLIDQLTAINGRRDAGVHTLGEIWRRHRVSCPTRQELGSYLLGALAPESEQYVKFHLDTIGCRLCQANVRDLEAQQAGQTSAATTRRTKYFQSSVGKLKGD